MRGLAPGEEDALSRLFYLVYGYDYINEFVYYPEKIKAMIEAGDLLPIVAARPNGRLVGHVGLVRRHREPAVYEAAMGAVDPMVKSRGLFGQLFAKTMEVVRQTPMQYCFSDCVTNHAFSQRHVAKFGGPNSPSTPAASRARPRRAWSAWAWARTRRACCATACWSR